MLPYKFTRKNLQKLSNWADWDAAFNAQLNAHWESGVYGLLVPHATTSLDGGRPNILHQHWSNLIKPDGTHKCCSCLDGSKCAAPWLHEFIQTYASCIVGPHSFVGEKQGCIHAMSSKNFLVHGAHSSMQAMLPYYKWALPPFLSPLGNSWEHPFLT